MPKPHALALSLPLAFALVTTVGCRGPKSPEQLKKEACDRHPERVALYRDGERPARPYRVLTEVDAIWFVSKASRTRSLQSKACQLGADGVIDVTEQPVQVREQLAITPWGAFAVREVRPGPTPPGLGLAIVFVDGEPTPRAPASTAVPGPPAPSPEPTPSPAESATLPLHTPRW